MSAFNVTASEKSVLVSLMNNHYSMGEDAGGMTWDWAVNESNKPSGITGKSLSGVIASLNKKGLLHSSGRGEDAAIGWASNEAYDFAKSL